MWFFFSLFCNPILDICFQKKIDSFCVYKCGVLAFKEKKFIICNKTENGSYMLIMRLFGICFVKLMNGVTGRPETMCPRTSFLRALFPKIIRPGNTMSLHWYIPVIMHQPTRFMFCIMDNDRNVSMQGHCVSGTIAFWGPEVPDNPCGDTSFQDVPPPHQLSYIHI